ncbi:MAG: hypothetical protein IJD52_03045 [Alphaproteobacteria bacterium]|nr:hypothetical protein [Alphaproteobacteria bacterium]
MNYQQNLVKLKDFFGIRPSYVSLPVPTLKSDEKSNKVCTGYMVQLRYPDNTLVSCSFKCGEGTAQRSACDIAHDNAMRFYQEQQAKARGVNMAKKFDFKQVFETVKYKLQHAFDWEIVGVNAPWSNVDARGNITAWTLDVFYKHHGRKRFIFDVKDERLWTTYKNPQEAAQSAYKMYFDMMQKQRAKKMALQR